MKARAALVEPFWMDVFRFDAPDYEQQLDVNAAPTSAWRQRHRERRHTGEPEADWKPGPAPSRRKIGLASRASPA